MYYDDPGSLNFFYSGRTLGYFSGFKESVYKNYDTYNKLLILHRDIFCDYV